MHEGHLTTPEMICKTLLIVICCIMICFNIVLYTFYCIFNTENDPRAKLKLTAPIIYCMTAFAKYVTFIIHEGDIKTCLKHVTNDWKFLANVPNARDAMIVNAKTARKLFTVCCTILYFTSLLYHLTPLIEGNIDIDENATIKLLINSSQLSILDQRRNHAFEIVFLLQFFGGFIICTLTIALYGLNALLVMHTCAQMTILMTLIKMLSGEEACKGRNVDERLAIVVEHQTRTRSFLSLVEKTLQHGSLFDVLGCTMLICLVGYCILIEWQDGNIANTCTFLFALISNLVNIFVLCYIGEHITAVADQVAWTTNMLEWYRLPTNKTRNIVLIIITSHIPLKITAGKLVVLSFRTFGNVVKSAVAYLNILRTVVE
ncbi:ObirOr5-L6 [Ooceraea biroi]|uniref:Odorant receptor n=1 Tax=Ooceraea biroi TaxID=2015173 RepID=A0A026W1W5_OOCBI|nr:hypothetical protein X777_11512 [Ooceraea biroi]RLU15723.1 ObirOr5-L6 [Ooceraea biroi]